MTTLVSAAPAFRPPARSAAPVLRRCACGGKAQAGGKCEECRKKRLQRSPSATAPSPDTAPRAVHDVLRSPGQPLDGATRAFMEPRFGHSFANVRVHADQRSAESASAVRAKAYAVGRDVVFGRGMYSPASGDGRRLIAHELAHGVQQSGSASAMSASLEVGPVDAPEERQADAAAEAVMRDARPELQSTSPAALAREPEDASGLPPAPRPPVRAGRLRRRRGTVTETPAGPFPEPGSRP